MLFDVAPFHWPLLRSAAFRFFEPFGVSGPVGPECTKLSHSQSLVKFPVLPFLVFWDFLVFLPCEDFLVFFERFSLLFRDFRRSVGIKNPCFLVVFLAFFQKNKERKDRVCRKLPFARNFPQRGRNFRISFAKPFAFASEFLRNADFAASSLRFVGSNSLANFRGASEFAFAFAAVSLRPRCTQRGTLDPSEQKVFRRQEHAPSLRTTLLACALQ